MQTIWSRIAQTRGTCHCPQCLQSSVQAVSARATASATRRAPKFVTSSTLWYSGIFAAAATFDVGAKKQRREQWDQAIAGVKQELEQGAEINARNQDNCHLPSTENSLDGSLGDVDLFSDVAPNRRLPQWPANTGTPLKVHRLPPESIYADSERQEQAEKRRWHWKKLEVIMLSIDMLQMKLFLQIHSQSQYDGSWKEKALDAVPAEYVERINEVIANPQAFIEGKKASLSSLWQFNDDAAAEYSRPESDTPLCNYKHDDQGNFHHTVRELNQSLQELFRLHATRTISTPSLLAKIAFNLHITSAPPNVHTYNTLLLGFSKAQQTSLVYSVIRSLRETHVRPNEITNTAILDHYRTNHDKNSFIRWIEVMRGKYGGLALARPDIRINEAGERRLVRDEERPGKVIQLPYPTPNVFGAVIKGVLQFGSFDTALSMCESMGQEGWGLCMSGLTPLLMDCADRGDWTSGTAVWRQIEALKAKSARHFHRPERIGLHTYAAMIRLCTRCARKDVFQDVWDQAVKVHPRSVTRLAHFVKVQDAERQSKETMQQSVLDERRPDTRAATSADVLLHNTDVSTGPVDEAWPDKPLHVRDDERDPVPITGKILREMQTECDQYSETKRAVDLDSQSVVQNPTAATQSRNPSAPHVTMVRRPPGEEMTHMAVSREQLEGLLPPSQELDEYELSERPMTMYG